MSERKYFDKTLIPKCKYCAKGRLLSGGKEVFCLKNGLVDIDDSCGGFKYDPLKRVPSTKDFGRDYSPDDFIL